MTGRAKRRYGVFCIEGEWYGDFAGPTTVEGALQLLRTPKVSDIPYIHRNVGTGSRSSDDIDKIALGRNT
jgi:hypothetical protein